MNNVTRLLKQWGGGDEQAFARIIPLIYAELRSLAEKQLRRERPNHTLQATALVHDLYLRLAEQHGPQWEDRQPARPIAKSAAARPNAFPSATICRS